MNIKIFIIFLGANIWLKVKANKLIELEAKKVVLKEFRANILLENLEIWKIKTKIIITLLSIPKSLVIDPYSEV